MKLNKYKVAILGLGNIGSGYNHDKNEFSHGNCIKESKIFNLILGIDIDENKRKKFKQIFRCKTFANLKCLDSNDIDTIIIATPTNTHFGIIKKIIKEKKIKTIILEKPCGKNYLETKKIISLCKKFKKILLVNYQRLFNPKWLILKQLLKNQKVFGTFHYTRGFKNNCSHVISLLIHSNFKNLKIKKIGQEILLYCKNLEIIFIKNKKTNYYINEAQFFTDNFRIVSFNSFNYLKVYKKETDLSFKRMFNFSKKPKEFDTEFLIKDNLYLNNIHKIITSKKYEKFYDNYILTSKLTDFIKDVK